jgi:hypothetical protein
MKKPIANLDYEYAYSTREAETQSINAFCAINDWKLTEALRGFAVADAPEHADIYPHGMHFNRHGRPVAMMSWPYDNKPEEMPVLYGKLGGYNKVRLKWSVPPARFASLYYPRWMSCYILTGPETVVRWLPE